VHICLDQWCTSGTQNRCSGGRSHLNWAIISAMSTINAVQEQYARNEGLTMMHMDHAVPIGGATVHICLDQWCTSGTQNRCSGGRSHLNWTIISAMSTINAVQEQYARNEGLTMMHIDHAVPIGGATVHICLDQWCTSGTQNRCLCGRSHLNWTIISAMSTINAVQEQYARNEGLTMMHMDHAVSIGGATVHICLDQWCTSGTQNRCLCGRSHLNWAIISAMSTINAVQEQYARNEGLTMMHMDHAVPIGGATVHICLDQWCTSGTQNRCSGGRSHLNWAIISAMSTINAVQEQYARNEGLTMMHMDHSVPIGGATVHICLDQWCTSGTQNRCSGGRFHLNWTAISAMSTINAVQEHYVRNEGLTMMHMDHSVPIGGATVHICLDQWCTSGTQNRCSG